MSENQGPNDLKHRRAVMEENERLHRAWKLVKEERRRQGDAELLAQKEAARLRKKAEKIPAGHLRPPELKIRNKPDLPSKILYDKINRSGLYFIPEKPAPDIKAKPTILPRLKP